jgi:hypothetical protein
MSTIEVPIVITESELNTLMTRFQTDQPAEAIIQAVKSYLTGKFDPIPKANQSSDQSVVEETHGLIHIDPEIAKAIAEDDGLNL